MSGESVGDDGYTDFYYCWIIQELSMTILLTQTGIYHEYGRLFIFYKSDISFHVIIHMTTYWIGN